MKYSYITQLAGLPNTVTRLLAWSLRCLSTCPVSTKKSSKERTCSWAVTSGGWTTAGAVGPGESTGVSALLARTIPWPGRSTYCYVRPPLEKAHTHVRTCRLQQDRVVEPATGMARRYYVAVESSCFPIEEGPAGVGAHRGGAVRLRLPRVTTDDPGLRAPAELSRTGNEEPSAASIRSRRFLLHLGLSGPRPQ